MFPLSYLSATVGAYTHALIFYHFLVIFRNVSCANWPSKGCSSLEFSLLNETAASDWGSRSSSLLRHAMLSMCCACDWIMCDDGRVSHSTHERQDKGNAYIYTNVYIYLCTCTYMYMYINIYVYMYITLEAGQRQCTGKQQTPSQRLRRHSEFILNHSYLQTARARHFEIIPRCHGVNDPLRTWTSMSGLPITIIVCNKTTIWL